MNPVAALWVALALIICLYVFDHDRPSAASPASPAVKTFVPTATAATSLDRRRRGDRDGVGDRDPADLTRRHG